MKSLSFLIKPASSLCNLRCKYCFYADVSNLREVRSFGIMTNEVVSKILESIFSCLSDGDDVTFGFQGGEPTLAGLDFFEYFTAAVAEQKNKSGKRIKLNYSIQTNGILLDDDWCSFLARHSFLTGLSMDATSSLHNENRVDTNGSGTYSAVLSAKKCLIKHDAEFNILCVLTNQLARYPRKVWSFLTEQDIKYVQFIPCLGNLDSSEATPFELTPRRFASFYSELLNLWAEDLFAGKYRSVKFFDDLFNLILKKQVTSCGFVGQCQPQFIIEADGSVYPCDFYVLDEWRCGSLLESTPTELLHTDKMREFLQRPHTESALCREGCRWLNICKGGCVRMRRSMYLEVSNGYCGYKDFLDTNSAAIDKITVFLRKCRPHTF